VAWRCAPLSVASITVPAAPLLDGRRMGLLSASKQPHPGELSPGDSSPLELPGFPSPSRSPYRPGPTTTVSPGAAFMIPQVMERHGSVLVPHVHDPTVHDGATHPG